MKKPLRVIGVLLNLLCLSALAWTLTQHGAPDAAADQILVTGFILAFIVNAVAIWLLPSSADDSWPGLFFERKRLEEKVRVMALREKAGEAQI
ncbi:hypothetical protein [uncultured Thiodictyon sp.]|uniref:hypothetical protein n=1 Tax=uncultured Thiodictyon sp. TaxID=1846217 RepID=UPI0025E88408|nr:hypothetical protein [uncultured Thiodictyon sp.]